MFELLGLSLLLAALLTFNSLASLAIAALWRVAGGVTRSWTAISRARLLFSLRTLPALLALLSATGIAVSIYRAVATHRATVKLTADWLRQGTPLQIAGISIEAFQIDHPFPLLAIVGFLRPRLFVASQVLEILSPEEIS